MCVPARTPPSPGLPQVLHQRRDSPEAFGLFDPGSNSHPEPPAEAAGEAMPAPRPEGCPDRQPRRDSPTVSASADLSHPFPSPSPFTSSRNPVIVHHFSVMLICNASHIKHTPFSPPLSRSLPPRCRFAQDFRCIPAGRSGALLSAPPLSGHELCRTPETPGFKMRVVGFHTTPTPRSLPVSRPLGERERERERRAPAECSRVQSRRGCTLIKK